MLGSHTGGVALHREGIPRHDHGRKMTVVARLPVWMQQAKSRDEALRAIARIHASLLRA